NDPSIVTPPIGSGHYTVATRISGSGQIVGYYNVGVTHGFTYSSGTDTTFDSPNASGAGGGTFPQGVNDSCQNVGYAYQVLPAPHQFIAVSSFLDSGGTFTPISDPLAVGGDQFTGPRGTFAEGINNAGQIVGYYNASGGSVHGFLLSGGVYTT